MIIPKTTGIFVCPADDNQTDLLLRFPYHLLAEWTCFIASLILLKNQWSPIALLTKIYLFLVVFVETICRYVIIYNNQWVYNFSMVAEFIFGMWVIPKLGDFKKARPITLACFVLFFVCYIADLIRHRGFDIYFDNSYTIGSAIMICLCVYYYYTIFFKEEYTTLSADPVFWFISGYLIYYTATTGFDTFFEELEKIPVGSDIPLGTVIMDVTNLILYGFWTFSFICLRNKRKYMLQL